MGKKSARKRRQRERRRQELDRLRGVSLADSATPTPKLDESPSEPSREHLKTYGKVPSSASDDISSPSQSCSAVQPHGPQHATTVTNASPAHSILTVPLDGPKAPSWKRVDFVLPRALGQNEFVFSRPDKKAEIQHYSKKYDKDVKEIKDDRETNQKTSETIDEILFPKKHRSKDPSDSAVTQQVPTGETNHRKEKSQEEIFSASRRRKLEDTFERVHRESIDETVDARNFVDIPNKREKKELQPKESTTSANEAIRDVYSQLAVGNSHTRPAEAHHRSREGSFDNHRLKQQAPNGHVNAQEKPPSDINHRNKVVQPPIRGEVSGRSVEEAVRDKHGLRPRANSTDGELNLPQGGLCDERMVLEAYKWNKMPHPSPKGFHNLGNTCFLNATLQCLAHVPPLCQTLIAVSESKKKKLNGNSNNKGQTITFSLSALFRQAHGIGNPASMGGAIAPRSIVNALPAIGSCGSRNGYKFRPGRQEDAHEFLVHLLDAMNDGELRAAGINQHTSGWRDRVPVSRLDETTFVHRVFGGYFRSQVRCQKCNYCSNTYDPFLDLSLEVSKKSSNSVLEALAQFTRKETLDAENQWKCSGCKKYVCATKQLTVFRPPLALCIQLKRFAFNNSFGFGMNGFSKMYGGGGSKISKPIDFPADLNLPLSDKRSCAYSLTGIVIHVGGSASSGHYTACVKRPGKNGTTQWYHLDDSFVEPISEKTVLRQRDAYLLFYCRKEVKIEYPTPPPRSMSASEAAEFGRNRARARADSLSQEDGRSEPVDNDSTLRSKSTVKLQKTQTHPLASYETTKKKPTTQYSEGRSDGYGDSNEPMEQNRDETSGDLDLTRDDPLTNELNGELSASTGSSESDDSTDSSKKVESGIRPEGKSFATVVENRRLSSSVNAVEFPNHGSRKERLNEESTSEEDLSGGAEQQEFKNGVLSSQKDVKTRVVMNSTDSRGKVKVMLGPRKKRIWESKAKLIPSKEKSYQLLGNLGVQRWDEDDSGDEKPHSRNGDASIIVVQGDREKIVEKIQKEEQSRKRKMHLDRWDSHLDQGRQKKVKSVSKSSPGPSSSSPSKNRFQSLQVSVQKMVRGKAKGFGLSFKKSDRKKIHHNGFRR